LQLSTSLLALPITRLYPQLPQSLAIIAINFLLRYQEISAIYNNNLIQQEEEDEKDRLEVPSERASSPFSAMCADRIGMIGLVFLLTGIP